MLSGGLVFIVFHDLLLTYGVSNDRFKMKSVQSDVFVM